MPIKSEGIGAIQGSWPDRLPDIFVPDDRTPQWSESRATEVTPPAPSQPQVPEPQTPQLSPGEATVVAQPPHAFP